MVRVCTECCHGFTALTVVLVTRFELQVVRLSRDETEYC
jgi:hypothetical protein